MTDDFWTWLKLQLFWAYQIVLFLLAPVFVLCACWALLNWHDPGLVHLKATWAEMTKPPAVSDEGLSEVRPTSEPTL